MYLYIAVSSSILSGGEQKLVFYVNKSLDGAERRNPALEKLAFPVVMSAQKLRPYFQSHVVVIRTTQLLRTILHSPSQSGRMARWAVELSEYDIEYRGRTASKSQVLADSLVELAPEPISDEQSKFWSLYVDASSS